jgi:predicted transcriptional regulator of viral defense system
MVLDRIAELFSLPTLFTYREAHRRGLSDRVLRSLVEEGALLRLGRGLYRRADAGMADEELIAVAKRAPDATLCLVTALARHELVDQIPDLIDVALPRSRRPPRIEAPVRWHRFDEVTFSVGREEVVLDDGASIGLYTAERSIIDAFRLRHIEGEELAIEALRTWLRRPGSMPGALLMLARAFPKAEPSLREALKVLL